MTEEEKKLKEEEEKRIAEEEKERIRVLREEQLTRMRQQQKAEAEKRERLKNTGLFEEEADESEEELDGGQGYSWQNKHKEREKEQEKEIGMDGVDVDLFAADGEEDENAEAVFEANAKMLLEDDEKLQAKIEDNVEHGWNRKRKRVSKYDITAGNSETRGERKRREDGEGYDRSVT